MTKWIMLAAGAGIMLGILICGPMMASFRASAGIVTAYQPGERIPVYREPTVRIQRKRLASIEVPEPENVAEEAGSLVDYDEEDRTARIRYEIAHSPTQLLTLRR